MRVIILTAILLRVSSCFANEIDDLKTLEDVNKFLKKADKVVAYKNIFDSTYNKDYYDRKTFYNKQPFIKADINSDGLTDLLINGNYLFVVFDKGDNNFEAKYIDGTIYYNFLGGYIQYNFIGMIHVEKTPLLIVKKANYYSSNSSDSDTLIFKFDNFIEYNASPNNLKIKKIKFTSTEYKIPEPDPNFTLYVNPNQTTTYHEYFYDGKKKLFKATIDSASFNKLIEIVNYIQLNKLKTEYHCRCFLSNFTSLEIKYNNTRKKIEDVGQAGTLGLLVLYRILHEIHTKQEWKE